MSGKTLKDKEVEKVNGGSIGGGIAVGSCNCNEELKTISGGGQVGACFSTDGINEKNLVTATMLHRINRYKNEK